MGNKMKLEIENFNINHLCYKRLADDLIENQFIIKSFMTKEEYKKYVKIRYENYKKLTLEAEDSILDEKERKYLSGVIRPFRDRITDIIKHKSYDFENKEYIVIHCNQSETTLLPYFEKGSMYKGMKLDKQ